METQVCSSCGTEKELSKKNFHKRGPKFQKICKTCRNESARERHATSGRTRTTTPSPINTENMPALAEIISGLEPHLRAKAARFSGDGMEADDIYSVMVEMILTKSKPSDSPAQILQRANWAASDYIFKKQTYTMFAEPIEADDETFKVASVEDEIIQTEISAELKAVIAQLPSEYRTVVSMLTIGMNQKEIAKMLNVTEQAVSKKIQRIGASMMQLGLSPA